MSGRQAASPTLRILFLLAHPPDLAGSHGGARATAEIIAMLSSKHRVSVLYLAPEGQCEIRKPPPNLESLTGVRISAPPASPKTAFGRLVLAARMSLFAIPEWAEQCWLPAAAASVEERAAAFQPDIVHCEFHVMGQYIPAIRRAAPDALCIVTEHEVGVDAAVAHGSERSGWRRRLGAFARRRSWARFERRVLAEADAIITFTDKDREIVRGLIGDAPTPLACIPLRFAPSRSSGQAKAPPVKSDLLFVGNFMHPPNVDAAMRLVNSIFPKIREAIPDAELFIVGASPPEDLRQSAGAGVTVTGWVESVQPYLAGTGAVLAPVRQGGGMRVKMIEALGAGKAVVASALAAEGLDLRPGEEFVLANSDEEFVQSSIELLSSPQRRKALAKGALRWRKRSQSSAGWLREYEELYARAREAAASAD